LFERLRAVRGDRHGASEVLEEVRDAVPLLVSRRENIEARRATAPEQFVSVS
jgi:hypothetical protein